jgi:hypothetical protein
LASSIQPSQRCCATSTAGHGYAILFERADAGSITSRPLDAGDNLPLGVNENALYVTETIPLPAHGQLLV